jgi:hypothetical protein
VSVLEKHCNRGCENAEQGYTNKVNSVRKSSTFEREGLHGASNPVFAEKGIVFIPAAEQWGILSNGVNGHSI